MSERPLHELLKDDAARLESGADVAEAKASEHLQHGEPDEAQKQHKRASLAREMAVRTRLAAAIVAKSERVKAERKPRAKGEDSPAFMAFWNAYPSRRRGGKGNARRSWEKLKCEPRVDQILATLEKLKKTRDWQKDGGDFIPMPATWLNREGWEDDFSSPSPAANKAAPPADDALWREFLAVHKYKAPNGGKSYAPPWMKTEFEKWKQH